MRWLSIWLGILWWGTLSVKVCIMSKRTVFTLSLFRCVVKARTAVSALAFDWPLNLHILHKSSVAVLFVLSIYVCVVKTECHTRKATRGRNNKSTTWCSLRSKVFQWMLKKTKVSNYFEPLQHIFSREHQLTVLSVTIPNSVASLHKTSLPGWLPTVHSWAPPHRCRKSSWRAVTWLCVNHLKLINLIST